MPSKGRRPIYESCTHRCADVGSRKLARLLEHAQQEGAKVVLVGDDRQLAAIDAGGGFRVEDRQLAVGGPSGVAITPSPSWE
jgi:hypothetical protein